MFICSCSQDHQLLYPSANTLLSMLFCPLSSFFMLREIERVYMLNDAVAKLQNPNLQEIYAGSPFSLFSNITLVPICKLLLLFCGFDV